MVDMIVAIIQGDEVGNPRFLAQRSRTHGQIVLISLTLLLPSSAGIGEEEVDDMDELSDVSLPPARLVVDPFPRLSHSEEAAVFGVPGGDRFSQLFAAR
jgi:hypothetical protein